MTKKRFLTVTTYPKARGKQGKERDLFGAGDRECHAAASPPMGINKREEFDLNYTFF